MELQRGLGSVLAMVMMVVVGSVRSYEIHVGGQNGWVAHPCEDYNHWAQRTRFQLNDTLVFNYKKGTDSVHVVKKEDYNSCNTDNPLLSLADGDSTFKLDRSGPFFFISGNADACRQGQRLIVVVLAVRSKPPPPGEAAAPNGSASVEVLMNVSTYAAAPTPAPNGSGVTSVGLVLSLVCVGVVSMVFW